MMTVSSELCLMLVNYASANDIQTDVILRNAGIKEVILRIALKRIGLDQFGLIWKSVEIKSHDTNFGLNFGYTGYSIKGGGLLASILKNCPKLEVALKKLIRYHDLSGELSQLEMITSENSVSLICKPL